jgi:hypothetical protein
MFLFATAAKSIQEYIFRGGRLSQMVGASELVESLTVDEKSALAYALRAVGLNAPADFSDISRAAGGARLLIEDEAKARRLAAIWPMVAHAHAPGLEVVQALVPVGDGGLGAASERAEASLVCERNAPSPSLPQAGPLVERSARTGKAAAQRDKKDGPIDEEQVRKQESNSDETRCTLLRSVLPTAKEYPFRREDWTGEFDRIASGDNAYMAVVHVDGNGMGNLIRALWNTLGNTEPKMAAEKFRKFSEAVSDTAREALRKSLEAILPSWKKEMEREKNPLRHFPFRPLVCAGDDVTFVVRACDAAVLTKKYIETFESISREKFTKMSGLLPEGTAGLTAGAGIAFVKSHFPFAMAYDLAESLCKSAKKATERKGSAIAFWRVSGTATDDFETVLKRELAIGKELVLTRNPYGAGTPTADLPSMADLMNLVEAMKKLPRGALREVARELHDGTEAGVRRFNRVAEVCKGRSPDAWKAFEDLLRKINRHGDTTDIEEILFTTKASVKTTPLLDALQLRAMGTGNGDEEGQQGENQQ